MHGNKLLLSTDPDSHASFRNEINYMSDKLNRRVEIAAYCAIILLSLFTCAVLAKRFFLNDNLASRELKIQPGTKISLPNEDWGQSDKTLLFVLSETCIYCSESAPFYQKILSEGGAQKKVRFIAILPQSAEVSAAYLNKLGLSVDEIKQASPSSIGVRGTPTLILLSRQGTVIESWRGKLSAEEESSVLEHLRS
jgi:thioredoxin-related protein